MDKKSRSGSGMNIPGHISESLETNFGLKILILDEHPGSYYRDLEKIFGLKINSLMRIPDP
jgi:hypothetical protein